MALDDLVHQHDQCQLQGQFLHACFKTDTEMSHVFMRFDAAFSNSFRCITFLEKKRRLISFNMSDVSDHC